MFQIVAVNVLHWDAVTTATLLGAIGVLLGAVISLVANQPPTVNEGDTVKIATPAGQPNVEIPATIPPLEPQ